MNEDLLVQGTGTFGGALSITDNTSSQLTLINEAGASEWEYRVGASGSVIHKFVGTEKYRMTSSGDSTQLGGATFGGDVETDGVYKVSALNTAPSSSSDTGTLGEIRYTADYIYVCTATDTWKRTAISTW